VRTHGTAALQQAVEVGSIAVTAAAEIAKQPEEEQVSIVGQGSKR